MPHNERREPDLSSRCAPREAADARHYSIDHFQVTEVVQLKKLLNVKSIGCLFTKESRSCPIAN